ncbi:MAG: hypothetical protein ACKOBH_05870 [bacterium]
MTQRVDSRTAVIAGLLQLVLVAALGVALGLSLPHDFFESWGWLAGPAAWLICAAMTALIIKLSIPITILGAVVAGIPSAAATLTGVHWLGVAVGIVLFALWCGRLAARRDRRSAGA